MKNHILFIAVISASLISFAQPPQTWTSRGTGGGGALFHPSINPANNTGLYISTDMSGYYRSTDQGISWNMIPFYTLQGGTSAEVRFTNNPSVMYAISNYEEMRPMKSTNGGATWNVVPGNPYSSGAEILLHLYVDYNNPNTVLLADYGTIYLSLNGGTTFIRVHTCIDNNYGTHIGGVFFDGAIIYLGTNEGMLRSTDGDTFTVMTTTGIPATEEILTFAGAKQGSRSRFYCLTAAQGVFAGFNFGSDFSGALKGIYSMSNASGTWTPCMSGITASTDYPVFVGMAENDTSIAYVGGGDNNGLPLVMKSTNGGNWTKIFHTTNNQNVYTGYFGAGGDLSWGWSGNFFGFTVSQRNANYVMVSGWGCSHITTDGGTTWKQVYVNPADQNQINTQTPKGKSYRGNGLENTTCWDMLWLDSLNLLTAFTDITGLMSADAGKSWKLIPISENTISRIVRQGSTLYASTSSIHDMYQSWRISDIFDAGKGKIYYSTNNGASFSVLKDFGYPVIWIETDPTNPNRMYATVAHSNKATIGGIYVTNNLNLGTAATWTKMPNPVRSNGHPFNIKVLKNGDLVATYSARKPGTSPFTDSSGVYYLSPFSATWSDRSHTNMRFWTQDIVIDPNDTSQSTWYAGVYQGWGTTGINETSGLYKTTNKGASWTKIFANSVSSCAIKPGKPDEVYVATEAQGLFYSNNATAATPTFTRVDSYPFAHPMRIFYNPYNANNIWVLSVGYAMAEGNSTIVPIKEKQVENFKNENIRIITNYLNNNIIIINRLHNYSDEGVLSIYGINGKELVRRKIQGSRVQVDIRDLSNGVYFVKLLFDKNVVVRKIIMR